MRGDAAAALPWLEKVLELDARARRARALLGDALLGVGRLDEARTAWLKAAAVRGDDPAMVANLAAGNFKLAEQAAKRSDVIVAERMYRRAAALDPSHERARERLAELLAKHGPTAQSNRTSPHSTSVR